MNDSEEAQAVIDFLGGTAAMASLFVPTIKPPSVSEWRKRGIPRARLMWLAPLLESTPGSRWTRRSLFPDDCEAIWPDLREQSAKQPQEA